MLTVHMWLRLLWQISDDTAGCCSLLQNCFRECVGNTFRRHSAMGADRAGFNLATLSYLSSTDYRKITNDR